MALVDLDIEVTSNTDSLSALAVHDLFARMVSRITDEGEDALRVNALAASTGRYPDKHRGAMVEHVDSRRDGDLTSEIGVTPVEEARAVPYASFFTQDPADYPLFRDRGTESYGSPTGGVMRFDGVDGPVFRRRVGGQQGAEFMLATFEEMTRAIVPAQIDLFETELHGLLG